MSNTQSITAIIRVVGAGLLAFVLAGTGIEASSQTEQDPASTPSTAAPVSERNEYEGLAPEPRDLQRVIEDAAINATVRAELMRDEAVGALDISVKTHRGIVRLSGEVESEAQRNHAVSVAINAPGVYGVNDTELRIRGS
jgi:hyperosmotically inducible periplasmic protein